MGEALSEVQIGEFRAYVMSQEAYAHHWPKIAQQLDYVKQYWEPWWTKEFLRQCQVHGFTVWACGPEGEIRLFAWTQVVQMPAMSLFQIVLLLGNGLDRGLPALEACFEKAAKLCECEEFEILGRVGWEKKLRAKRVASVFRRKVPKFMEH